MNEPPETEAPDQARLRSIDVMRGLAILWVVLYHLHEFMNAGFSYSPPRRTFYEAVLDQARNGNPWHTFTALGEVILATGADGVPVFMLLGGLSLTMLAVRSGRELDIGTFYGRRVKRLLIPYWAGWAVYVVTLILLAAFRTQVHGEGFRHNLEFIGPYGQFSPRQALDGLLLFPRGFSSVGVAAVPPSLWFVWVLFQYYLLFPIAYVGLMRVGPWAFAALALALSMATSSWWLWYYGLDFGHGYIWSMWWPFHPFEFALGMSMGYWLARRPEWLNAVTARWPLALSAAAVGFAIHTFSGMLDTSEELPWLASYPLKVLGLGLVVLVVAAAQPGAFMRSSFAKMVAWIGVISYTVLIVNDCFRVVNNYLVIQGYGYSMGWWLWITLIFVPGTVALAYPLAAVLGLLPRAQRDVPTANGGVAT